MLFVRFVGLLLGVFEVIFLLQVIAENRRFKWGERRWAHDSTNVVNRKERGSASTTRLWECLGLKLSLRGCAGHRAGLGIDLYLLKVAQQQMRGDVVDQFQDGQQPVRSRVRFMANVQHIPAI